MSDLWTGEETLVPATLRGYRSWRVRDSKLVSTGVAHEWERPEVAARCLLDAVDGGYDPDCPCDLCAQNSHAAPVKNCSCGIYGWYDPADSRLVRSDVFGVVEVAGRAVMASHGFRAERARIVALAIEPPRQSGYTLTTSFSLHYGHEPSADELHHIARWAKTHEIPVFTSRVRMLEEFPPQDVSGLVDHSCDATCVANAEHSRSSSPSVTLNLSNLTYGPLAMSSTYFSSAAATAAKEALSKPPQCRHRRFHIGLIVLSLLCLLMSVPGAVTGSWLALVAVGMNSGLLTYWTRHYLKQHRKPKQAEPAEDDSDDEEESW